MHPLDFSRDRPAEAAISDAEDASAQPQDSAEKPLDSGRASSPDGDGRL